MTIKTRIPWKMFLPIIQQNKYEHDALDLSDEPLDDKSVIEFVDAMESNTRLKHLKSAYGFMGRELVALLIRLSLVGLDISRNGISTEGFETLCKFLPHNKSLMTLNIGRNYLTGEDMKMLAKALGGSDGLDEKNTTELLCHRTLQTLDVSYNPIGDEGARALASVISNTNVHAHLSCLDITGCSIGRHGAKALLSAIAKNRSLTKLMMDEGCLSSDEARSFLKRNTTITDLELFDHKTEASKALDADLVAWLEGNKANAYVGREYAAHQPVRWGKMPLIGGADVLEEVESATEIAAVATVDTSKNAALNVDLASVNLIAGDDLSEANLAGVTLDIRSVYSLCIGSRGLSENFKNGLEKEAVSAFKAAYKSGLKEAYPTAHYFFPGIFYCGKSAKELRLKDIVAYIDSRALTVKSRSRDICCGPNALMLKVSKEMAELNFSLDKKLEMVEDQERIQTLLM